MIIRHSNRSPVNQAADKLFVNTFQTVIFDFIYRMRLRTGRSRQPLRRFGYFEILITGILFGFS